MNSFSGSADGGEVCGVDVGGHVETATVCAADAGHSNETKTVFETISTVFETTGKP